ncbi:MAG: homoaconitate hydratase [Actinobacteria bacterium]|nr:homoaconitate hydratase [Actinomycetota bacterium]
MTGGRSVLIADCTLREGEQQPGIVLDSEAKVRIGERLADLGIVRAEIGTPAVSEGERAAVAAVVRSGAIAETVVVCRAKKEDVELAAECGVWGVVVSSPVSPFQLEHKLHMTIEQVIERVLEVHEHARTLGLKTFASAYDSFRTPEESLRQIYEALGDAGMVDGVRLVDTVGVATPERAAALVAYLASFVTVPIEVHFHDDFGLAMANAVASVAAGAEVSSSIAGVGERAGNVATEEIAAALHFRLGLDTGLHMSRLAPVCRDITRELGLSVSPNKAVFGRNAFRHVAGLTVGGFLHDPLVAQPLHAEELGATSEIALGKVSGKDALEFALRRIGIDPAALDHGALLDEVKRTSEETRRLVSDSELIRIVRRMSSDQGDKENQDA